MELRKVKGGGSQDSGAGMRTCGTRPSGCESVAGRVTPHGLYPGWAYLLRSMKTIMFLCLLPIVAVCGLAGCDKSVATDAMMETNSVVAGTNMMAPRTNEWSNGMTNYPMTNSMPKTNR